MKCVLHETKDRSLFMTGRGFARQSLFFIPKYERGYLISTRVGVNKYYSNLLLL